MKSKKWSSALSIVIAASILTGCASFGKPVVLQANLTATCPPLPTVPDEVSMGDLLRDSVIVSRMYLECSARHKALVEAITPR